MAPEIAARRRFGGWDSGRQLTKCARAARGGARPTAARPCRARTGRPACRSAGPTRPGSRSRVPRRQYLRKTQLK